MLLPDYVEDDCRVFNGSQVVVKRIPPVGSAGLLARLSAAASGTKSISAADSDNKQSVDGSTTSAPARNVEIDDDTSGKANAEEDDLIIEAGVEMYVYLFYLITTSNSGPYVSITFEPDTLQFHSVQLTYFTLFFLRI